MKKSLVFGICLVFNLWIFGAAANRMIYRQPFDFQNVPSDAKSTLPFSNAKFTSNGIPTSQQQIMHTGRMVSQPLPNMELYNVKNSNNNLDGIFQMLNEITDEDTENKNMRAAVGEDISTHQHGYGYLPSTYPQLPSNYGQLPGIGSSKSDSSTQPKFNFVESMASKSENKMNGLITLVLSLLTGGSTKDNPFGKGVKDVIINGLIRPLLVAKGGIKMIISRLAIPVVSLILINVEVLITVWWLWDDCPVAKAMEPKPEPNYGYNYNYNSSYLYN